MKVDVEGKYTPKATQTLSLTLLNLKGAHMVSPEHDSFPDRIHTLCFQT